MTDTAMSVPSSPDSAPLVNDGPFNGIPLADSHEISRIISVLPWSVLGQLQTIQAHCVCILDEAPNEKVRDLTGCISQCVLELSKVLAARATGNSQ